MKCISRNHQVHNLFQDCICSSPNKAVIDFYSALTYIELLLLRYRRPVLGCNTCLPLQVYSQCLNPRSGMWNPETCHILSWFLGCKSELSALHVVLPVKLLPIRRGHLHVYVPSDRSTFSPSAPMSVSYWKLYQEIRGDTLLNHQNGMKALDGKMHVASGKSASTVQRR